jgi:hypothetical protein
MWEARAYKAGIRHGEGLSELAADQYYILEVLYDSTSGNYII